MHQFYLIGFLIVAVAIATFAIQNSGEVLVKFMWWQFQSSLVVVILISTALGAIMAILLSLPGAFRLRGRSREQAHRIAELEQRMREPGAKSSEERSRPE